jgi:acetyltransferase-like isoleucine patch superfamily enzyme
MFDIYKYHSSASSFLGFFKKILFINQYTAGVNFRLFAGGGIIGNKENIHIGNHVSLYGWLISDGGEIKIGDYTVVHSGSIIRAKKSIVIGDNCLIGTKCYIQDHNSMSLNHLERRKMGGHVVSKPVIIGNDVWVGRDVSILKGVHLGDRAIVGTRSVVTKDVPPDHTAVGNPARVIEE